MKLKRFFTLALALCMIAGLLAGCGDKSNDPGTTVEKDTLNVALTDEPDYLSTCDTDSLMCAQMNLLTYNGLTRIDMKTLQPELDLAESYSQDSDTEWTFVLKQGVTFHNGDTLTAEDVKASIEYAKSYDRTSTYTSAISEVQVVDDGTGPYKFVSWDKGNALKFEANEAYFDAERTPSIKNLVFSIIPEGTTRTMALESGDVDFIYSVSSTDIDRLKAEDGIDMEEVVSVENFFLFLNAVNGPFVDSNLRLAVAYAINREDIVAGALNGYGEPSYSCVPMGYAESVDTNAYSYDLDKAKEYLAAWGGDPSTVTMNIICSNDTKTAIATIMQSELAELGINVVIDSTDSATYQAAMATDTLSAAIVSWSPANAASYVSRFHSDRRSNTPASVATDKMDELVSELRVEMDANARTDLIHQIIADANATCWYVPIYQVEYFRAHSSQLQNVVCSATGYVDFAVATWG